MTQSVPSAISFPILTEQLTGMNVEIFIDISYPHPLRQNLCCSLILLRNRSDIQKLFVNLQLCTVGTKRPALGDEGDAFVGSYLPLYPGRCPGLTEVAPSGRYRLLSTAEKKL